MARTAKASSTGEFLLASVPSGDYMVAATVVDMERHATGTRKQVSVRPGQPSEILLRVVQGNGSVEVAPWTMARPDTQAVVHIVPGQINAQRAAEFEAVMTSSGNGAIQYALALAGESLAFTDLAWGIYSVCAMYMSVDPEDPAAVSRLQEASPDFPVRCQTIDVSESKPHARVRLEE